MREISLEELLEAGCHFGHQVTRQNPKARDFIFEARDNIHIIDLEKTKEGLETAARHLKELAQTGKTVIVVGTKRQAQNIIAEKIKQVKEEAPGNIYYVTTRWIGGILTNFAEVKKNSKKLTDIVALLKDESMRAKYTKKELGLIDKERQKLEQFYGGVLDMDKIPDALFIIDTHLEDLAVREAKRMGVETIGIVDTNADPYVIDYPIPANDDAVGSVKLIVDYMLDAWSEGKKQQATSDKKQEKKEEKKEEPVAVEGQAAEKVVEEKPKKRGRKKKK